MPEIATNATSNKRTRIDPAASLAPPETTTKTKQEKQTPKTLANAFVRRHVSSLQPEVASLVERFALKQVDTLIKYNHKLTQHKRLAADESFIPRSARIKFDFYMTPEAEATDAFTTLRTNTNKDLDAIGHQLKAHIMSAIQIECESYIKKANQNFAEAIFHITKSFLFLSNGSESTSNVNATVKSVLDHHHEALFKHLSTNVSDFTALYDVTHSTTMKPPSTPANPYTHTYASRLSQQSQSTQQSSQRNNSNTPTVDTTTRQAIARALEATFVTAYDEYLDQVQKNKIASQLKAYQTEILTENATLETVEQLDLEKSVTPERLQELIAKETKKAISGLERQVQSLTDTIQSLSRSHESKNGNQRGRSRSASTTKKKKKKEKKKTSSGRNQPKDRGRSHSSRSRNRTNQRPRDRRAYDSDSDSDDDSYVSTARKKKKKSTRRSDADNRQKKPSNVKSSRK